MAADRQALKTQIEELIEEIKERRQRLCELRREASYGEVEDFALKDVDGTEVRLSSLFGESDDLIVIHNMGKACPYCTLWADGFNGVRQHLENRAGFVLVTPDAPEVAGEFAASRGWSFRVLSSHGTPFKGALGFEKEDGKPIPGYSTFRLESSGTIRNVANDTFGPGDEYCSVWHMLDHLENGADGWQPKFAY